MTPRKWGITEPDKALQKLLPQHLPVKEAVCTLLSHVHLSCKELTLGKQGDKNQYDWKCNLEVLGCMLLDAHKSMHNAKMHKMPGKKKRNPSKKV